MDDDWAALAVVVVLPLLLLLLLITHTARYIADVVLLLFGDGYCNKRQVAHDCCFRFSTSEKKAADVARLNFFSFYFYLTKTMKNCFLLHVVVKLPF